MSISSEEQLVVDAVSLAIRDCHPGGVTLEVVPAGVRQDQDWWYVPVRPSFKPPKRYEYYESLSEVEIELQRSKQLTVLLVPTAPLQSSQTC